MDKNGVHVEVLVGYRRVATPRPRLYWPMWNPTYWEHVTAWNGNCPFCMQRVRRKRGLAPLRSLPCDSWRLQMCSTPLSPCLPWKHGPAIVHWVSIVYTSPPLKGLKKPTRTRRREAWCSEWHTCAVLVFFNSYLWTYEHVTHAQTQTDPIILCWCRCFSKKHTVWAWGLLSWLLAQCCHSGTPQAVKHNATMNCPSLYRLESCSATWIARGTRP